MLRRIFERRTQHATSGIEDCDLYSVEGVNDPRNTNGANRFAQCALELTRGLSQGICAFDSLNLLEDHLVASLNVLQTQNVVIENIVAWDWIVGAFSTGNQNHTMSS